MNISVNPNKDVQWTFNSPLVYLDLWAIKHFSRENPNDGIELIKIIQEKFGTLLLSLAHVIEYSDRKTGGWTKKEKDFFDLLGCNWFLINWDPIKVAKLEARQGFTHQNLIDRKLIVTFLGKLTDNLTRISFSQMLDEIFKNANQYKKLGNFKSDMAKVLNNFIENIPRNNNTHGHLYPERPVASLLRIFLNNCKQESVKFKKTEGVDFYHLIVPVAYANFVSVEKKWYKILQPLQYNLRTVMFGKDETDSFLQKLRKWPVFLEQIKHRLNYRKPNPFELRKSRDTILECISIAPKS